MAMAIVDDYIYRCRQKKKKTESKGKQLRKRDKPINKVIEQQASTTSKRIAFKQIALTIDSSHARKTLYRLWRTI